VFSDFSLEWQPEASVFGVDAQVDAFFKDLFPIDFIAQCSAVFCILLGNAILLSGWVM